MSALRRMLLLHEQGVIRDERVGALRERGWDVIAADHQDLWWPKFIESTRWEAIVIDSSSLPLIMAEVASELGSSPANQETPLYLIGLPASESGNMPTPLRRAIILDDYSSIP